MTDEQLIAQYQQSGDNGALDQLVSRHLGKTRAMIYAMVLNDADADDLTQESFLKAVNHLDQFKRKSAFSTWLFRIAMNTTHNFLRKKLRNRLDLHDITPDQPDPSPLPANVMMNRETDARMHEALAQLPAQLRAAFNLVVLQELSPKDAARIEGCFLSTMYRRVDSARRELQAKLGDAI